MYLTTHKAKLQNLFYKSHNLNLIYFILDFEVINQNYWLHNSTKRSDKETKNSNKNLKEKKNHKGWKWNQCRTTLKKNKIRGYKHLGALVYGFSLLGVSQDALLSERTPSLLEEWLQGPSKYGCTECYSSLSYVVHLKECYFKAFEWIESPVLQLKFYFLRLLFDWFKSIGAVNCSIFFGIPWSF